MELNDSSCHKVIVEVYNTWASSHAKKKESCFPCSSAKLNLIESKIPKNTALDAIVKCNDEMKPE